MAGVDSEGDDLGDFVRVKFQDSGLEELVFPMGALDEGQYFGGGLDGVFPAVDGFDPRDKVYAGGELFLDQGRANAPGGIGVGKGAEDEDGFFGHREVFFQPRINADFAQIRRLLITVPPVSSRKGNQGGRRKKMDSTPQKLEQAIGPSQTETISLAAWMGRGASRRHIHPPPATRSPS